MKTYHRIFTLCYVFKSNRTSSLYNFSDLASKGVFINVTSHKIFERDKNNIICDVAIPFTTAALGGSIEVPTIEKKMVSINIPQGMQSGHKLRVKGKGMSILRNDSRGDMIIRVHAETPVNLSKDQKELSNVKYLGAKIISMLQQ